MVVTIVPGYPIRLRQLRARLVPNCLKHKVWEAISKEVAGNYRSPPKLPKEVFLETRTRCNSGCRFCPASIRDDPRGDTLMPRKMFHKCIDELADLGFGGTVGLFNNNEPLLDKRMVSFVEYISRKLPDAKSLILTNGIILTQKFCEALLQAGLGELVVDCYKSDGRLRRDLLRAVRPFCNSPDAKITVNTRFLNEKLNNRAGWSPNNGRPVFLKAFCSNPFVYLTVTTDGDVAKCCIDFLFQERMGNVMEQSIQAIWNGKEFRRTREHLLKGDRSFSNICSKCDVAGYRWEDLNTLNSFLAHIVGAY